MSYKFPLEIHSTDKGYMSYGHQDKALFSKELIKYLGPSSLSAEEIEKNTQYLWLRVMKHAFGEYLSYSDKDKGNDIAITIYRERD